MNGWEHFIAAPAWGACVGVGTITAAMNLRDGPDLHAAVQGVLEPGVQVYVFDPVLANEPAGEWLPVLLIQAEIRTGWVHSSGVRPAVTGTRELRGNYEGTTRELRELRGNCGGTVTESKLRCGV